MIRNSNTILNPDQKINSWLAGQLSKHTARAYEYDIKQFFGLINQSDIQLIDRSDIFKYRQVIIQKYKPATVNRKLSAVRQLFEEAVHHRIIENNPATGIKGFKTDSNYSNTKAPDIMQVRKILDSISQGSSEKSLRDLAMMYIFCTLGLRRDEVSNLKVNSIINDNGLIALDIIGKGNKTRRVEIPGSTYPILEKWINSANLKNDDPIFQEIKHGKLTGRKLTGSGIYWIIQKYMGDCDLKGFSPHSLRHFLITLLLERGESIYSVQRLAGHSDPRITERYDRNKSGVCSSAANVIDF